jgi:hypothetical protein
MKGGGDEKEVHGQVRLRRKNVTTSGAGKSNFKADGLPWLS